MLLENTESAEASDAVTQLVDESPVLHVVDSDYEVDPIRDDIERLIRIAGQLFSAIERQIHRIEVELNTTSGPHLTTGERTAYKEKLLDTVRELDVSLQEIALQLGERAMDQLDDSGLGQSRFLDYF